MNQTISIPSFSSLPRLLIVDDNPSMIRLLGAIFDKDYQVTFAIDGKTALEMVEKEPPCLILLDVMMPEMDGYEVCKHLKNNELTANIPVIFVTAKSNSEEEFYALNLGAVDYLCKPISPQIAKIRVKNHIKNKYAQGFSTMAMDALSLAILIVDEQGAVKYINTCAKELLNIKIRSLTIKDDYLSAINFSDKSKLSAFITAATSAEEIRSAMFLHDDEVRQVFITPLPSMSSFMLNVNMPLALILITEPNEIVSEVQLMGKLYDLSPAELRVATALLAGKSPGEYAIDAGLTLHTVRSQLKNLFSKTYTRRQSELVALLSKLPPLRR
jgi:DNA-binding response OmpR family regulator